MDPPGRRIVGNFELLEPLGAGGMGEVFKARDRRLNRFVALKFLPQGASREARERFHQEALAIASLNHPHICTLHEVGDDGERPYLVLELLEGETLKARLRRGALKPAQLLDCAAQIADALDAAHRKGVLHRDLKPDNIWISPGGHVKVLDFGLARLETVSAEAKTRTSPLTSPGVAMGTAPYMSPEQARGQTLDARSDIFSFGSVFYEMASGRPAFPATNAADAIAGILKGEPPRISQLRPDCPRAVEQVAERCLEKEPDLRYQSAADLRGELKRLQRDSGTTANPGDEPVVAAGPGHSSLQPPSPPSSDSQIVTALIRRRWRSAATVATVIVLGVLGWLRFRPHAAGPPPPLQFRQLTFTGDVLDASISPDGKFLAHVDAGPKGDSLNLLSIGSNSDVQIVPPGGGCCFSPSFSPDDSSVYFLLNRTLSAVPMLGGPVRTIAENACTGAGYSPDGSRIAFLARTAASLDSLMTARVDGTQAQLLHATPAGEGYLSRCRGERLKPVHSPAWSPDGRWIEVDRIGRNQGQPVGRVELVSVADGRTLDLGPNPIYEATDASWLPGGGGLVFTAAIPWPGVTQVWEIAYPSGTATQLTNDLQGYAGASLSSNGELALIHSAPQYSIWSQASPGGELREMPGGGVTQDGRHGFSWTPNGGFVSIRTLGATAQLWTEDGVSARELQLSNAPGREQVPMVAPNGQIVFEGDRGTAPSSIWRANADGTGLVQLAGSAGIGGADNPVPILGGQAVAYLLNDAQTNQTLWAVPLAGGTPWQIWPGFVLDDNVGGNAASPDGSRIFAVHLAPDHSQHAVIIRLASSPGGAAQVTPVAMDLATMHPPFGWTPDGRAITYIVNHGTTDNIWAFPLPGADAARKPYALTRFTSLRIAAYAFSRDGRLAISRGSQNSDAVFATGVPIHP